MAIYSHGKLGQFNTLSEVGRNKLYEVYLVGEFFVDSFEDSDFPDMALSNRQGYKTDDPRYKFFSSWLEKVVMMAVDNKKNAVSARKQISDVKRKNENLQEEKSLRTSVQNAMRSIDTYLEKEKNNEEVDQDTRKVISDALEDVGIKRIQTQNKMRKILISQTSSDVKFSNLIYELLLFNNFQPEDILYTNSEDEVSHIPWGMKIYEYLREFFAQSFTNKPLFVIYVDTDESPNQRGVQMEVGAGWVSQTEYDILKCGKNFPLEPLDSGKRFAEVHCDTDGLFLTEIQFTSLYQVIVHACGLFDIKPKSIDDNRLEFLKMANIVNMETYKSRLNKLYSKD